MPVRNVHKFFNSGNLIDIEGYKLILADHLGNIKKGGVFIYSKESLPLQIINQHYSKEALLLEMSYNNKNVIVSVIHRSPSKSLMNLTHFYLILKIF